MNPMIQLKSTILPRLSAGALICFALSPAVYAQCSSLCDNNGNTATGIDALTLNISGNDNTATGAHALAANTTGSFLEPC